MPRINSLDWKQESTDKLHRLITNRMDDLKVTNKLLGNRLGITGQAFGQKLSNMNFTWYQYLIIWQELDITGDEVSKVAERIR